jgi:hypothetical protein
MAAWVSGKEKSADEQTIGFNGNHQDKQCINYRREGDGVLTDAISEDGRTYSYAQTLLPSLCTPQSQYTCFLCPALS